mmetsp:Transcript_44444/g.95438  ORF Transcript_44444/g.95438 Transcript_44444/m.95438 type:complete len:474 (+) Transcript_44444:87-1508(+)
MTIEAERSEANTGGLTNSPTKQPGVRSEPERATNMQIHQPSQDQKELSEPREERQIDMKSQACATEGPSEQRSDKEALLEAVKRRWYVLKDASEELRADKAVVLAAMKQNEFALKHASKKLLADKDFALAAVALNGWALKYLSEGLRADQEVVLQAVKRNGLALQFASDDLRFDRSVVVEAVKGDVSALQHAAEKLRASKDVALEAVKQDGLALKYASEELQADKDVVLQAVKQDGDALKYASEGMQADIDVVMEAVKQNGLALEFAGTALQANLEVVLEAIRQNGRAVQSVSEDLQRDQDILLLAARCTASWGFWYHDEETKAIFAQERFKRAQTTLIAVRGEQAPILSVRLCSDYCPDSTDERQVREATFTCEVSFMSGTSFVCWMSGTEDSGTDRLGPGVNDLARKLVEMLPVKTQVQIPQRVFINFVVNDDGEAIVATPWDWDRPLADFLPLFQKGSQQPGPRQKRKRS